LPGQGLAIPGSLQKGEAEGMNWMSLKSKKGLQLNYNHHISTTLFVEPCDSALQRSAVRLSPKWLQLKSNLFDNGKTLQKKHGLVKGWTFYVATHPNLIKNKAKNIAKK